MFMLAVAQIGVVPVLGRRVVWLFWKDETGLGHRAARCGR